MFYTSPICTKVKTDHQHYLEKYYTEFFSAIIYTCVYILNYYTNYCTYIKFTH